MKFARTRFLIIFILLVFFQANNGKAEQSSFELHLLDVGQGLSILVKADGHYLLYDGGGARTSSYVVSYLKEQGITELDYVVVSHYDDDHLNGIVGALHVFSCGTVLAPDYIADTDIYASYISAVWEKGIAVVHPSKGDIYYLGNATIKVIGPSSYNNTSENNNCISLCINYSDRHFLICGDLEAEGEEELVNSNFDLSCDLYVVNHHGSASSSTFYFLNHVLPSYALLSCGQDNSYGHPSIEVMERLQAMNCELYRTDKQGTIIAYSDGNAIWFNTEPCTDWSSNISSESESTAINTSGEVTYVCNTNTYKFHYEYCDSVEKMKEENKRITSESRDSLIAQGYEPCKNCCP